MEQFVTVARVGQLAVGRGTRVQVGDRRLALYSIDGRCYAIDEDCPHAHGPLSEGPLDGMRVSCPLHGWIFDVTTGACPSVPGASVQTYPVRLRGEEVQVGLR